MMKSETWSKKMVLIVWATLLLVASGIYPNTTKANPEVDPKVEFNQANRLYDQQQYEEATAIYDKLHRSQDMKSPSILYNLGNAHFRSGKVGHAVAAYLAARRYAPTDPDIKANLKFVLEQTQDQLETSKSQSIWSTLLFWVDYLNYKVWLYIAMLAFATFLFLAGLRTLKSELTQALNPILITASIIAIFGFVSCYLKHSNNFLWGAVTSDKASIHSSPSEGGVKIFELGSGAPFIKIDSTDLWVQIELSDGKRGWIKKVDSLILLSTHYELGEIDEKSHVCLQTQFL